MGWLQDVVPNHMTYDSANPWLADLFENGSVSQCYRFFDIDWDHRHPDLYQKGQYLPLAAAGRCGINVVAFAQRYAKTWSLTLAPRFVTGLIESCADPLGCGIGGDTVCRLPTDAPPSWTDAFTMRTIEAGSFLKVGDVFNYFPVALLTGGVSP